MSSAIRNAMNAGTEPPSPSPCNASAVALRNPDVWVSPPASTNVANPSVTTNAACTSVPATAVRITAPGTATNVERMSCPQSWRTNPCTKASNNMGRRVAAMSTPISWYWRWKNPPSNCGVLVSNTKRRT